jgi:hypothetical protein
MLFLEFAEMKNAFVIKPIHLLDLRIEEAYLLDREVP